MTLSLSQPANERLALSGLFVAITLIPYAAIDPCTYSGKNVSWGPGEMKRRLLPDAVVLWHKALDRLTAISPAKVRT